jgi:hypothetical protein
MDDTFRPILEGLFPWSEPIQEVEGLSGYRFMGPDLSICLGRSGSTVYLTDEQAILRDLLGQERSASLAAKEAFRQARQRCEGGSSSFMLFLDLELLLEEEMNRMNEEEKENLDLTGIDRLRAVSAGIHMAEGRAKDTVWLDIPRGRYGLMDIFAASPVERDLSRLAPDNTLVFLAANVRFRDVLTTLLQLDREDAPRGVFGSFRRSANEVARELGFRSFTDIVGFLGTEIFLFAALPKGGGLIPEAVAAMEVLEPDRLQTNLFGMARTLMGVEPESLNYKQRKIYYLPTDNRSMLNLGLCWCLTDGYLLFSTHPTVLKGVVRRLDGETRSLKNDPEFKEAWKMLPEGAPAAGYVHTRRLFNYLYGLLLPVATMANAELPFDSAMLPTGEAIEGYLSFGLSGLTLEKEGIRVRTDSDGYGPTSMTLYGLIAAGVITPLESWSENVEKWPSCGYNMKRIHEQLEAYRNDHPQYPADLGALGAAGQSAYCPMVGRDPWDEKANEYAGMSEERKRYRHFQYVVEVKGIEPPESFPEEWMIVWDDKPRHNDGRVVLLWNGEVTWMPEAAFKKRLEAQK